MLRCEGSSAALCGQHQRSILNERSGITKILNILPSRTLTCFPPAGHGIRPSCIQRFLLASNDFRKVWADVIQIDIFSHGVELDLHISLFDENQRMPFVNGITNGHTEALITLDVGPRIDIDWRRCARYSSCVS